MKAERSAMNSEIADSLMVLDWRIRQQPCVHARLDEIRKLIQLHQVGERIAVTGPVGAPRASQTTRGTWDIALFGQVLNHMPVEEKLRLSGVIGTIDAVEQRMRDDGAIWDDFAPLSEPELMGESDWDRVRSAYFKALDRSEAVERNGAQFYRTLAEQAGVAPSEAPLPRDKMAHEGRICERLVPA